MFEHLDDPEPFVATEGLRASVVDAGGRLRRRRRRQLVGGGAAACAVAVVVGGWAYVDRRDAAIERVEVAAQPSVDGAVNILLLGDDGSLAASPEVGGGARIDAAVLVRLDEGGVHLLSIPRDLADPATGERFNVLAAGDLQASVDAVGAVLGDVPLDHVVRLDFEGFVALVDAVGGVPVAVHRRLVDEPTGTELEPTGCTTLDGPTALGLVRARHVVGDPTSDLGRTARQRALLQAALAAVDPGDVDALSRVVADHALVSDGLDLATMVALGRRLTGAPVAAEVLPVVAAQRPDGAAILRLADGAGDVLARFGATNDAEPGDPAPGALPLEGVVDDITPC